MFNFKRFALDFFSILFPDYCNACGQDLYHGEQLICTSCLYDLPYTDFQHYAANPVAKLFWGRLQCHAAMAMLYYRKGARVQRLIHQLKYHGKTDLGFKVGTMLGQKLALAEDYKTAELILPVPIHPKKEKMRGYNQCTSIANGIAAVLNITVDTTVLQRQRATDSQTKKNRFQRFENMIAVFTVRNAALLKGRHVILVDDVITTGATIEACGQVLLDAGVIKLSVVSVAFTE